MEHTAIAELGRRAKAASRKKAGKPASG